MVSQRCDGWRTRSHLPGLDRRAPRAARPPLRAHPRARLATSRPTTYSQPALMGAMSAVRRLKIAAIGVDRGDGELRSDADEGLADDRAVAGREQPRLAHRVDAARRRSSRRARAAPPRSTAAGGRPSPRADREGIDAMRRRPRHVDAAARAARGRACRARDDRWRRRSAPLASPRRPRSRASAPARPRSPTIHPPARARPGRTTRLELTPVTRSSRADTDSKR